MRYSGIFYHLLLHYAVNWDKAQSSHDDPNQRESNPEKSQFEKCDLCVISTSCSNNTCICDLHYEGEFCEREVDYCEEMPCGPFIPCISKFGTYECECPLTYTGRNCDVPKIIDNPILKNPGFILHKDNYLNIPTKMVFYVEQTADLSKFQIIFDDNSTVSFHSQNLTLFPNAYQELLQQFYPLFKIPSTQLYLKYLEHTFTVIGWHKIQVLAWNHYELTYNVTYTTYTMNPKECVGTVSFPHEKLTVYYRWEPIHLIPDITWSCAETNFIITWDFLDKIWNQTFTIPPYTLDFGEYIIKCVVETESGLKIGNASHIIRIERIPVIPHISGGSIIPVKYGERLSFEQESKDLNNIEDVVIKWECSPGVTCPEIVVKNLTRKLIVIPFDGNPEYTRVKSQEIRVSPIQLRLECQSNCFGGFVSPNYPVGLIGTCGISTLSCEDYNVFLIWNSTAVEIPYQLDDSYVYIFLDNLGEFNQTYRVVMKATGREDSSKVGGSVELVLQTFPDPGILDCRISPESGMAFVTRFTVVCTGSINLKWSVHQYPDPESKLLITNSRSSTIRGISLLPGFNNSQSIIEITGCNPDVCKSINISVTVNPIPQLLIHLTKFVFQPFKTSVYDISVAAFALNDFEVPHTKEGLITTLWKLPMMDYYGYASALSNIVSIPEKEQFTVSNVIASHLLEKLVTHLNDTSYNILSTLINIVGNLVKFQIDGQSKIIDNKKTIELIEHFRNSTKNLMETHLSVILVQLVTVANHYVTKTPIYSSIEIFANKNLILVMTKRPVTGLIKTPITYTSGSLKFHFTHDILVKNPIINLVAMVIPENPYWWHYLSNRVIQFPYVELKILDENRNKLPYEADVELRTKSLPKLQYVTNVFETARAPQIYRISIPTTGKVVLFFQPMENNRKIHVIVKETIPNLSDFDDSVIIPQDGEDAQQYTVIVDNSFNTTFIGILPQEDSVFDDNITLQYGFASYALQCLVFDQSNYEWNPNCKVRSPFMRDTVTCRCTNNTIITASYTYLTPKRIIILNESPGTNMLFLIKCFMLMMFIGLGIWSYRNDCEDTKRQMVVYLPDSNPNHGYVYAVQVQSGYKTTSHVVIVIEGTKLTSEPHLLKAPHDILGNDSEDWFIVKTKSSLGNLSRIHVWTDYSGRSPHWYCYKIIITDVTTNEVGYFKINRWFSPLHHDGTMSYSIPKTNEQLFHYATIFWNQFWLEVYSGGHIWLSVLYKHTLSRYTRLERLCVLTTELYLILYLNTWFSNGILVGCIVYVIVCVLGCMLRYVTPKYKSMDELEYGVNDLRKGCIPRWMFVRKEKKQGNEVSQGCFRDEQDVVYGYDVRDEVYYLPRCFWFLSITVLVLIVIYTACNFTNDKVTVILIGVTSAIFGDFLKLFLTVILCKRYVILENRNDIALHTNLNNVFTVKVIQKRDGDFYRPLSNIKSDLAIRNGFKRLGVIKVLGDLIVMCITILVFIAIHQMAVHTFGFYQYINVDNLLTGDPIYGVTTFNDVRTPNGIFEYLKTVVLTSLHGGVEVGLMSDNVNYLVGVPRLKQYRFHPFQESERRQKGHNMAEEFFILNQYYRGPGKFKFIDKLNDSSYNYVEFPLEEPLVGNFSGGIKGGFVTLLSRDLITSAAILRSLVVANWIDNQTRAVFLDINLYNPHSGYITIIEILFEATPMLNEFTRQRVIHAIPARDFEFPYFLYLNFACIFLLCLFIVHARIEYIKLRVLRPYRYWSSVTDLCTILLIIHTIAAIWCYLQRCHEMYRSIDWIANADAIKFYYFKNIIKWQRWLIINLSMIVLYSVWKCLQVLCITKLICLFPSNCSILINYLFYVFVSIITFGLFSTLLFGENADFVTFTRSFLKIVALTTRNFKYNSDVNYTSLTLLHLVYYVIVIIIFVYIIRWGFSVIILTYYSDTKRIQKFEDRLMCMHLNLEMTSMNDFMKRSQRNRIIYNDPAMLCRFPSTETQALSPFKCMAMKHLIIDFCLERSGGSDVLLQRRAREREVAMVAMLLESIVARDIRLNRVLECFYERERMRTMRISLNVERLLKYVEAPQALEF